MNYRPSAPMPRTAPRVRDEVERDLKRHTHDSRFQHELKEMQETRDLREVDDDVEDVATLFEWHALEHNHLPKSQRWFVVLAASITALVVFFIVMSNFIGAITTALVGGLMYYVAQQKPEVVRYRIMVDGVAINNTLYHYRDLDAFNIIYEPGETKTVILRSKRKLSPYIHMEIGEADPVAIRDVLLEFAREDLDLDEPFVDVLARRLGF